MGLLYGSIYFQLCTGTDQSCYNNRLSLFFFGILDQLFVHADTALLIHNERLMFYRERGAKAYGAFTYWFTLIVPALLFQFLIYPFTGTIIYLMDGLREGHFGNYFFINLLSNYMSLFIFGFISSISSSTEVSLTILPLFQIMNTLFAGYTVYLPDLPGFEGRWLPYIVWYRYAFQALVLNEFKGNNELPKAADYLELLGFNKEFSFTGCVFILLAFLGFFALAFYLALRFVDFEKR